MKTGPIALTPLLVAGLAGCALGGGQVAAPPYPRPPPEPATLILHRSPSLVGIFGTMHIKLDGLYVYRLGMGQSYRLEVTPGTHDIAYPIGLNDCRGIAHLRPGETLRIRLTPDCMMYRQTSAAAPEKPY